jgi:hypothetical protein
MLAGDACDDDHESLSVQLRVSENSVKDYYSIVKPEDAIWIARIREKVNCGSYTSREAFLADFAQMTANCVAYNDVTRSGHGTLATPGESSSPSLSHLCFFFSSFNQRVPGGLRENDG